MRTVLVTGAGGFVGRRLCADLAARGLRVRAAVRARPAPVQLPVGVEPVLVPGSVEVADWTDAARGADAVVHLIARTHMTHEQGAESLELYRAINARGTRRVLEAAIRMGVGRFIFLSSIKTVGEGGPRAYTEDTPCWPEDAYGQSKLEAEDTVRSVAREGGMEFVILRPPLIYGPGVRANFLRLIRSVERGVPLPLGRVRNLRSLLYLGNLTDAVAVAVEHPAAAGETFLVADGAPMSTPELVERIAGCLGRPPRLLPIPVSMLHLAGAALRRSAQVRRLTGSLFLSTEKIRRQLQWAPPLSVTHGLCETIQWYRQEAAR